MQILVGNGNGYLELVWLLIMGVVLFLCYYIPVKRARLLGRDYVYEGECGVVSYRGHRWIMGMLAFGLAFGIEVHYSHPIGLGISNEGVHIIYIKPRENVLIPFEEVWKYILGEEETSTYGGLNDYFGKVIQAPKLILFTRKGGEFSVSGDKTELEEAVKEIRERVPLLWGWR